MPSRASLPSMLPPGCSAEGAESIDSLDTLDAQDGLDDGDEDEASETSTPASGHRPEFEFDDIPASFSRKWIRGLLRNQYKYNGAVFCDDLCMKGAVVVGDIVERARVALASGCDMLPVCNERPEVVKLLDALPHLG